MQDLTVNTSSPQGEGAQASCAPERAQEVGSIDLLALIAWFTEKYNEFLVPLIRSIERRGIPHDIAENIAQNVFISIWSDLLADGPMPSDSIAPELFGRAKKKSADHYRRKSLESAFLQAEYEQAKPPHELESTASEEVQALLPTVDRCFRDELDRTIFALYIWEQLTLGEIAERLDKTLGTIQGRWARLLRRIQNRIAVDSDDHPGNSAGTANGSQSSSPDLKEGTP